MTVTRREIVLMEHAKRERRIQEGKLWPDQKPNAYGTEMALALARGDLSVLDSPPDDEKAPS